MRRRGLREDEEALWSAFVRDVRPLAPANSKSGAANVDTVSAPVIAVSPPAAIAPVRRMTMRLAPDPKPGRASLSRGAGGIDVGLRMAGVDNTSWKALESGRMRPQRTLDLHGHLAQAAFMRLHHFLHDARADQIRCVEVITGLGAGQEGGVIRRELPLWLARADLRPMILAVVHPHAANRGAVRILLRRDRQPR